MNTKKNSEVNQNKILVVDEPAAIEYRKSDINNSFEHHLTHDELLEISNNDPEKIFHCNTINCLTFITDNGEEKSLHEYAGQNIVFFRVTNTGINDKKVDFLISYDFLKDFEENTNDAVNRFRFTGLFGNNINNPISVTNMSFINAMADYNGIENTDELVKVDIALYPACTYCINLDTSIGNDKYTGYLPAAGQMTILAGYISIIGFIMNTINKTDFDYTGWWIKNSWWTSSKFDDKDFAWTVYDESTLTIRQASFRSAVFPFFKKCEKSE